MDDDAPLPPVSMLLLASGRGTRLGAAVPKAWVEVGGRTLLERSLARLAAITSRREIVLAVHPDDHERFVTPRLAALQALGLTRAVAGGDTRQESMTRALAASDPAHPLVLVHDAARPFFPVDAARQALRRAAAAGAALLAVPSPDTLKRIGDDGRVEATVERARMWLAQTPQVIRRELLLQALAIAARDGFVGTDDVSLLEHARLPGAEVVPSTLFNVKVTAPADLELATRIAAFEDAREAAR